jgi:SAM-dependent methyltransferase
MTRVLDIGAGENPHPDATTTMDRVDLSTIDVVQDVTEQPWPFETNAFDRVYASHVLEHIQHPVGVFEEVARVLRPMHDFDVVVPIGLDARTDPTHVHEWTWDTPEYFTRSPPYEYGWGLPFDIVEKDVDWWCDGPFKRFESTVQNWVQAHGPGKWLSGVRGLSGELSVTYRRCPE